MIRKALGVVGDIALLALLVALAGCGSTPTKPSVYKLRLAWTEPVEFESGESLTQDDLTHTLYWLACHTMDGESVTSLPALTARRADIALKAGSYQCQVSAQVRGAWSDSSNLVYQTFP